MSATMTMIVTTLMVLAALLSGGAVYLTERRKVRRARELRARLELLSGGSPGLALARFQAQLRCSREAQLAPVQAELDSAEWLGR